MRTASGLLRTVHPEGAPAAAAGTGQELVSFFDYRGPNIDVALEPHSQAAGMDGYLAKPLETHALNDEMHRVLPMQPLLHDGSGNAG